MTRLLSHRRMVIAVFVTSAPEAFELGELTGTYEAAAWIDPRERRVGLSTLARKVLAKASSFLGE